MPPDPTPASILGELDGWWIRPLCGCGRLVLLPCKMLARERSPMLRVVDVARRRRCRGCGERISAAELVDNPQGNAHGYVSGTPPRRVQILG